MPRKPELIFQKIVEKIFVYFGMLESHTFQIRY